MGTVTCAGHATIATGTFPHTHGIIHNSWWDRETQKVVPCTEDLEAKDVAYGAETKATNSGHRLLVQTLADVMRTERGAHIASVSLKVTSAAMMAGHGGDAVSWVTDTLDAWSTSSMYATAPVPAVQAFVAANPLAADLGKTWDRLLQESQYLGVDDGIAEAAPEGWTRTFPHVLKGKDNKADGTYRLQWERSPFGDAYLGRFAASLVESLKLGQHDGTDVLTVGFSSTDLVGHNFGPRSQEVQDMYAHLDRTVGALLDRLDALVGRGQYVVALSADHGVTPIPEQLTVDGQDAGRINQEVVKGVIEQQLKAVWGTGKWLAAVTANQIYFAPGVYERLQASPATLLRITARLTAIPGIQQVFRAEQMRSGSTSSNRLLRAASLSYVADRSGDLTLVLKPGWMFSTSGTTHGSASADDQRVPVVLYGFGVKPGHYDDAATPADIAPTLAELSGVTLPRAEGHALHVALKPESRLATRQ
jgi:predicted AlkP superfamily pyrophosphatase or phosphodiesterase